MISLDQNNLCQQAEQHYYDFLTGESRELIPDPIVSHLEVCAYCREQMADLKAALAQADGSAESTQHQADRAVTAMLKAHFTYVGAQVTCATVKPFLPSLLSPVVQVRVPTPITVHLDNCAQCSQDLETIERLDLTQGQLGRLSLLLAGEPKDDEIDCSQARAAIPSVASMAFGETSEAVVRHLCTCAKCRELLYQQRDRIRAECGHATNDSEGLSCGDVSASDVFDCVVPYALDPDDKQCSALEASFVSHVRCCPTCLGKVQELHRTVYEIVERPESGVATTYTPDASAKGRTAEASGESYSGFPIRVQVSGREDRVKTGRSVPAKGSASAPKQRILAVRLKVFFKPLAAAAAVVVAASAIFFGTRATGATPLDEIYRAIEQVRNVHIASFVPGRSEPVQEKWVSKTLNAYMTRTGSEFVLWDLSRAERTTTQLDTAVTETTAVSRDDVSDIGKRLSGSLGLLPFQAISEVPKGATWSRVSDEDLGMAVEDTQVWDLTWDDEASDGSTVLRRCRIFASLETSLPQRIELYRILGPADEDTPRSVIVVEYLSDREMQAVVEEMSL